MTERDRYRNRRRRVDEAIDEVLAVLDRDPPDLDDLRIVLAHLADVLAIARRHDTDDYRS